MTRPTTNTVSKRINHSARDAAGAAVLFACAFAMQGCGSDDSSSSASGGAGAGGAAGAAGTGATGASGGAAGSGGASGAGTGGSGTGGVGGAPPAPGAPCDPLAAIPCAAGEKCGGWFDSAGSSNLSYRCVPDGNVAAGSDCQAVPLSQGVTDNCSDGGLCLSTPGGGSSCFATCDTSNSQCGSAQPNCQAPYASATPGVCVCSAPVST